MNKLILICMIAFTSSSYAINPSVSGTFSKLNNTTTFQTLRLYLAVNSTQAEALESVFAETSEKLNEATIENNEQSAQNEINNNLSKVKVILTQMQYKRYLLFIAMSIKNDSELAQN